ncbi:hypothetical protein PLICRDRAFT_479011 [Plicaturopsis crispa FD-325 SS-3]|nr:hypothetical protein PLICRDRAFT_479011 [Plicaturopsis crispa FD-325 SS-3]
MDPWTTTPPAWYQPNQPSPHVYYPPQPYPAPPPAAAPWTWQVPTYQPPAEPYRRSRKYPTLNPALAADASPIRFDVRARPHESIPRLEYAQTAHQPATATATASPTTSMRLISRAFPWAIDIKLPAGVVTCEIVWAAVHDALLAPVADSEWGCLCMGMGAGMGGKEGKERREAVEKAAKAREKRDGEKRMRRVDFLGGETVFRGLERDAEFEKARLRGGLGNVEIAETWVVKMGSS